MNGTGAAMRRYSLQSSAISAVIGHAAGLRFALHAHPDGAEWLRVTPRLAPLTTQSNQRAGRVDTGPQPLAPPVRLSPSASAAASLNSATPCGCAAARPRSVLRVHGAEGDVVVGHEKERRHGGPRSASSPPPRKSAGRGHRRGLDGPSMPKPLSKNANVFLQQVTRRRGRVGWGFDRRRDRRDAGGSPRSANHVVERAPMASARRRSKPRNLLNPAVSHSSIG